MIRLQFRETPRQRKWRNGMLMHDCPEAFNNMRATAEALKKQEGWHGYRIINERSGRVALHACPPITKCPAT